MTSKTPKTGYKETCSNGTCIKDEIWAVPCTSLYPGLTVILLLLLLEQVLYRDWFNVNRRPRSRRFTITASRLLWDNRQGIFPESAKRNGTEDRYNSLAG